MFTAEFDGMLLAGQNEAFPAGVIPHPARTLYHGTSSAFARSIEISGFAVSDPVVSREEIAALASLCERAGCVDGWNVPFLMRQFAERDFEPSGVKKVYFGETSARVVLYATKRYAGGEAARLFRESARLLRSRLDSGVLSKETAVAMESGLSKLLPAVRRAEAAFDAHSHGLIYAIEIPAGEEGRFHRPPSMGIASVSRVPSAWIVAALRMAVDQEPSQREIQEAKKNSWADPRLAVHFSTDLAPEVSEASLPR